TSRSCLGCASHTANEPETAQTRPCQSAINGFRAELSKQNEEGEGNFSFVVCEDIDLPEDLNLDSESLPSDTPPPADPNQQPDLKPLGVAVLINKKWWRNAIHFSLYFAPKCIKPAIVSMAMIAVLVGTILVE